MTQEEFYLKNPSARPQPGSNIVSNPGFVEPELSAQQRFESNFPSIQAAKLAEANGQPEITPASTAGGEFTQQDSPFTTPMGYAQQPTAQTFQQAAPGMDLGKFQSNVNKIEKGLQIQSKAEQELANQTAAALGVQEQALQKRQMDREAELNARKQLQEQKRVEGEEAQKAYVAAQEEAGKGYWEYKSIGSKIAAAIAQGLGTYAAARTGTQNFAAQTIENAVRQDSELKIRKAQLAKDRTGAVAQRYDSLLADLKDESAVRDVMFADGLAVTKNKIDIMAARAKSEEAKARALTASGELGIKIGQYMDEAAAKAAAANGKAKAATADQSKAAGFARRLEQAEGIFAKLEGEGYDRSDITSGIGATLPNVVRGSSGVQQDQAERNFVNSVLRRESGAAISPTEFESAELQYFPRAGDDPQTLKNKQANRLQAIATLKGEAGDAALSANPLVSSGRVLVELPNGQKGFVLQENLRRYEGLGAKVIQ